MANKKTRRRADARSGAESHQRKQERLEARREAKAAALAAQQRAERLRRLFRLGVIGALIGAAVWFVISREGAPSEIAGNEIQTFSTAGAQQHLTDETETVDYETLPPASGRHLGTSPVCGTYGEPIPNEAQVHHLEHGAVGIQYQPTLDAAVIGRIETLVGSFDDKVFSAPYEGMDTAIAVTSWGRKMNLDSFDARAVRQYIEEFRGSGPEDSPCDGDNDDSFEPAAPSPPAPSQAAPSQAPEGGG